MIASPLLAPKKGILWFRNMMVWLSEFLKQSLFLQLKVQHTSKYLQNVCQNLWVNAKMGWRQPRWGDAEINLVHTKQSRKRWDLRLKGEFMKLSTTYTVPSSLWCKYISQELLLELACKDAKMKSSQDGKMREIESTKTKQPPKLEITQSFLVQAYFTWTFAS